MSDRGTRSKPQGAMVLVVGSSGVGKDTVIAGAAAVLQGERQIVFARRVVTRPPHGSEAFEPMTQADFEGARAAGRFALTWDAHGLSYGIPIAVDEDIAAGRVVVVNASRRAVLAARARYAAVHVVLVECALDVRAARMAARGRESAAEISARLARKVDEFDAREARLVLDNSGSAETAVRGLSDFLRQLARP